MSRIVVVDYSSEGHHVSYTSTLLIGLIDAGHELFLVGEPEWSNQFSGLVAGIFPVSISGNNSSRISFEFRKYLFISRCMRIARTLSPDIIHFLYLDHFVLASACVLRNDYVQMRFTLHWGYMLPEFSIGLYQKTKNWVERFLISRMARYGYRIMVHSDKLRRRLSEATENNLIDYVPYPLLALNATDRKLARQFVEGKTGASTDDRIILVFGDTRYDKGADIAVCALSYLPKRYHLLIAGKPGGFAEDELRKLAILSGVGNRVHLELTYIDDEDIPLYFCGVNVVLVPYRRDFSGQSGPLTIAAALNVPIAASNLLVLSETVLKYDLGVVFRPEDPADLAHSLVQLENNWVASGKSSFILDHSDKQFIADVNKTYFGC